MGFAVVDPLAKFKERSFIYSTNIVGGLKSLKGSHDPNHAPFGGNFYKGVGLAIINLIAKFKECSFLEIFWGFKIF